VFDIPTITVRVVEHRLVSRRCDGCGTLTAAAGPAGVTAPVAYGPHAAAIAVYLVLGQHLPVERTAFLLAELFGTPMAAGTVAAWTHRAAAGLEPFTAAAIAALTGAELLHADETGLRVAGRLHWLHVATSARFTALFCHRKRGTEAIDAAGVLPAFTGIAVHDAFAPYARYRSVTHALCNAHLLRELIAVVDHHRAHPETGTDTPAGWCWAGQIIDALLALKAITDTGAPPEPAALDTQRRLIISAALIGASTAPWPAASADAARTTCGLPPTCGCRSTTTPRSVTSAWPRSSRRCPAECAPSPAPRTSPRCAPTYPPRPNTAAAPSTSWPNSPAETSGSRPRAEQSRADSVSAWKAPIRPSPRARAKSSDRRCRASGP
jgi:transposase